MSETGDKPETKEPKEKPKKAEARKDPLEGIRPLMPNACVEQQFSFRIFGAEIPAGVPADRADDPSLWVNIARKLQEKDEIIGVADDYSYRVHMMVVRVAGSTVRLKILNITELDAEDFLTQAAGGFRVEYKGPRKKHCIIDANGNIIKEGISAKHVAYRTMDELTRALAS